MIICAKRYRRRVNATLAMTTALVKVASPQNHIRNAAVTVVENLLMGRKVVSNGKHAVQLILSYHA